jgi:hypothetical protein
MLPYDGVLGQMRRKAIKHPGLGVETWPGRPLDFVRRLALTITWYRVCASVAMRRPVARQTALFAAPAQSH